MHLAFSLGLGSAYGFAGGRLELILGHVALFGFYGGGARYLLGEGGGLFFSAQISHSETGYGYPTELDFYSRDEATNYSGPREWSRCSSRPARVAPLAAASPRRARRPAALAAPSSRSPP